MMKAPDMTETKLNKNGTPRKDRRRASRTDLIDRVFGLLTVRAFAGLAEDLATTWRCECACGSGKEVIARRSRLTSGTTKSCGCLKGGKIGNPTKYINPVIRQQMEAARQKKPGS